MGVVDREEPAVTRLEVLDFDGGPVGLLILERDRGRMVLGRLGPDVGLLAHLDEMGQVGLVGGLWPEMVADLVPAWLLGQHHTTITPNHNLIALRFAPHGEVLLGGGTTWVVFDLRDAFLDGNSVDIRDPADIGTAPVVVAIYILPVGPLVVRVAHREVERPRPGGLPVPLIGA